jgi:hypothetical protein
MSDEKKPDTPSSSPKPAAAARRDPGKGKTEARTPKKPSSGDQKVDPRALRYGAAALAGLIIGLLLGALLFGGDDDDAVVSASANNAGAQIVTPKDLAAEARSLGRPVYWAGPQDDSAIELERTAEGNTSVRYIPEGEDAGGKAGDYLTVVTYPYPDAHGALTQQASSGDVLSRELPNGGIVIGQPDQSTNAYLAYEGENYQVEVYDPRPGRALKLVVDGSVVPAG